jgi:hypothetical protein
LLFLLSIRLIPTTVNSASAVIEDGTHFDVSFDGPVTIQALDFALAKGSFTELMFKPHELYADGRRVGLISEFRALQMPFGARLIFNRPLSVSRLTGLFKGEVTLDANAPRPVGRSFAIGWGLPCWISSNACPIPTIASNFSYQLGSDIVFNSEGNSPLFTGAGWGNPETWGRWTDGREASLNIPLDTATLTPESDLILTAELHAFVFESHPRQTFIIKANGTQIGGGEFKLGTAPYEITATIPASVARMKTPLQLTIALENPISPARMGLSNDNRMLGLGLQRLRISAPHL